MKLCRAIALSEPKTAEKTAKAAKEATVAAVKGIIAAIKGLVAIIAAGGWLAVLIIIIMCMAGLLLNSTFGIFFSGEGFGTGRSMPSVVSALSIEFYNKVEDIKKGNPHDVEDISTMSINWPEVLAVYAVKVNTDPDNAMEVVTLDDDKIEILRGVFNDMVRMTYSLKTETQERTGTDEDGNETTEFVEVTTLVITFPQKSAEYMAM